MPLRFLPTPDQIAAGCAEIHSGWSATERMSRLRGSQQPRLTRLHELCRRRNAERACLPRPA